MSDKLFPYQRLGVEFIKKHRRVFLTDEMGLGKTLQAIRAIDESDAYPALIVVGLKIAQGVWQEEIRKWTGKDCLVYTGTPQQRKKLWKSWDREKQPYLIVGFMLLKEIVKLKHIWKAVVFDEYHLMGLRSRKTKTFQEAKKLLTRMMILCSGSPMSQGPQDFWPGLHLIDRQKFSSFWKYAHYYCNVEKDEWGRNTIGRYPLRPLELKKVLSRYMIRRQKKNVLLHLPDKTRQLLRIEMERIQLLMYRKLAKEMILELPGDELVITPSTIANMMALRQLLVSPQLLGSEVEGVGLATLRYIAREELDAGNTVAIFTPFRRGVELIANVMQNNAPHVYTLMGGMKPDESNRVIQSFQKNPSKRKILITTIKSAVSFTASDANVAFFLGQEWDHNDNVQAEDRLHRVGQKNAVRVYYLQHADTIEEHIINVLMDKKNAIGVTLNKRDILPS